MTLKLARQGLVILIVLGSLYGSIHNLISTPDLGDPREDPVAQWQARFDRVKTRLPFTRGYVGYISDQDVPGAQFNAANEEGEYILTQYAMAPIILVRGTDQEWNIGNLTPQAFQTWNAQNQGRFDVTEFSGGLYLFHKAGGG